MHANAVVEQAGNLDVSQEEALRANLYRLVSVLLTREPTAETLQYVRGLTAGDTDLGAAVVKLAKSADGVTTKKLAEEYFTLFIGVGRGVLVPYGSYYLTGFLHEKPLAKLRDDMKSLGLVPDPSHKEPEDHVSSVLEMMAGLIDGSFGTPASLEVQRQFYDRHIASWVPHFFRDLANAGQSEFYAAVGAMGQAFMRIEQDGFDHG